MEADHLEDLGEEGRILKRTLKKYGVRHVGWIDVAQSGDQW